jgi:N-acylneuraminate cytidylyltransferase
MTGSESLLAVIPARGGSKGLPGKNTRPFMGLPLIAHTILFSRMCPEIDRCVVTTDSPDIARVAEGFGAWVPFIRPAELAQDDTPILPALQHALAYVEETEGSSYEMLLLLDPTSPAREPADVSGPLRRLIDRPAADGIVSVSKPDFNPIWHCVVERDGWMADLMEEGADYEQRQEVPPIFRINGSIYIWRTEFLRGRERSWRKGGRLLMHEIPDVRSMSFDTMQEFDLAELMVKAGLVSFPWLDGAGVNG